ncbi:hypothetical protein J6590_008439 [Homalodisca vitripennis]|nr:hypothetical protein J6590_008439 [Homalodisca vitripennis]
MTPPENIDLEVTQKAKSICYGDIVSLTLVTKEVYFNDDTRSVVKSRHWFLAFKEINESEAIVKGKCEVQERHAEATAAEAALAKASRNYFVITWRSRENVRLGASPGHRTGSDMFCISSHVTSPSNY